MTRNKLRAGHANLVVSRGTGVSRKMIQISDFICPVSMRGMGRVTGSSWNSTKVETGGKREPAHATSDSSSFTRLASLSPTLRIVTHSFRVTPTYDLCARFTRALLFPVQQVRIRAAARRTHAHTEYTGARMRDQHAQSNLRPLPFIQSHDAFSLAQCLLTTLTCRFLRSLPCTLTLPGILVTHLPIISQSS